MRRFLAHIPLALTLAATGALISLPAGAADTRWAATGAQAPGQPDRPVWSFSASRAHPSVMLAATQGRGILRSADAGASWTMVTPAVDAAWVVRFDQQQPSTAYAGTQLNGMLKSVDEGKTWTDASAGLPTDVRSIDVLGGTLLAGTSRGVFDSTDGGVSWHALGLAELDVSAVAFLPKAGGFTLFAGVDNGSSGGGYLYQSEDLTANWHLVKANVPSDATVASIAVAPAASGGSQPAVIAGTSQGLFRSDDRGSTWSTVSGLPAGDINLVLFNPANADQIYVASDTDLGNGGVFRSLDRGASWSALGAGLPARPRITALALQPLSPLQVVAAAWNPTTGQAGAYRIQDAAAAIGGTSASNAPSASARPTAAPQSSSPQSVAPKLRTPLVLSPSFAVIVALIVAIGLFAIVRRWRMRREDRRTYAP
ncbi:MAG TPA: hypothetical protein VGD57_03765 [Candidatus Dormibacteraeota bacterium]